MNTKVLLSLFLGFFGFLSAKQAQIGSIAPDFTLLDETGAQQTLSTYRGQKIALYFYPKDDTPGCTKEACSIRDSFADLKAQGIVVFGVSYDSVSSHKKFKEKYHLSFHLLSDSEKKVAALYDVKGWFTAQRVTFLIDENGTIIDRFSPTSNEKHAQEILEKFTPTKTKEAKTDKKKGDTGGCF